MKAELNSQKQDSCKIQISIEDNGIGMTQKQIDKIFKPFSQADSSSTRKYGGTGLGLAICKALVKIMGGTLNVESEINKGSKFYFSFQLQKNKIQQSPITNFDLEIAKIDNAIKEETKRNKNLKILIVDDEEINRIIFVKFFKNKKIDCDIAVNGKEALNICKHTIFDLILMDCQMPIMNGYQATKEIRKNEHNSQHTHIVAITADTINNVAQKCFDSGINNFLTKPIKLDELEKIIQNMKEFGI